MASAAGLALRAAAIELKPKYKEGELTKVTLSRDVIVGGTAAHPRTEKRKAIIISITKTEAEIICRAIHEFENAATQEMLHLNTAALLYTYFRKILGSVFQLDFDELRSNNPDTVQGFVETRNSFVQKYIKATALNDQQRYLTTVPKPYKMMVTELATRLRLINQLMAYFPGANNIVPYTEQQLKPLFFGMMLTKWQMQFVTGGNEYLANDYPLQRLVEFMEVQETVETAQSALTQGGRGRGYNQDGRGYQGGRSFHNGRGGRDSQGRGSSGGRGGQQYGNYYRSDYNQSSAYYPPSNYRRLEQGGRYGSSGRYQSQGRSSYGNGSFGRGNYGRGNNGRGNNFGRSSSYGSYGSGRGRGYYPSNGGRSSSSRGSYQGRTQGGEQHQDNQYYDNQDQYYDGQDEQYPQDPEDHYHQDHNQGGHHGGRGEEAPEEDHWMNDEHFPSY